MTNTDTLAAALREILPFVAHHSTCPYSESSSSPDSDFCTCRVESLLRAADKALRGLQEPVPPPPKCSECHGSGRTDNHVTGEVECGTCGGAGFYPSGPTDAPIQTQCEYCDGTGWVGGEPVPPPPDVEAARKIAKGYKNAPCVAEMLGEVDPEHPCGCPSCGLAAIREALRPLSTTEDPHT